MDRASNLIRLLVAFCTFALLVDVAAEALPVVRVGLTRNAIVGPLSLAAVAGYFADEGLEVRLEFVNSDAGLPAAIASGALDVGVVPLAAPYFAFAAAHDLKMIASHEGDQAGYPGNTLVIAGAAYDAGLRTWKDLPGRRIGMTAPQSGLHYALAQVANKYGFDLRRVKIVWLQTPAKAMTALARGAIDAALVPASATLQLRASRERTVLRWVGDEVPWQESVVVAGAKTIRDRRAVMEKFMHAYERGTAEYDRTFLQRDDGNDIIKGPHYNEYLGLMARQRAVPPESGNALIPWSDRLGRLDVTDIQRQLQFWQKQGTVDKSVSTATLLDLSFASEHIGELR